MVRKDVVRSLDVLCEVEIGRSLDGGWLWLCLRSLLYEMLSESSRGILMMTLKDR